MEKVIRGLRKGYSTMSLAKLFFMCSTFLSLSSCNESNDAYAIYASSFNPEIAYVIERKSGRFFVSEKSWKFSIVSGEFDRRIYPKFSGNSFSLPQLNIAIPLGKDSNLWQVSNISCKKIVSRSDGFEAECNVNGKRKYTYSFDHIIGLESFSADCMNKDGICKYELQTGLGVTPEIIENWDLR